MDWIHEKLPRWDEDKRRIVAGAPKGVFEVPVLEHGQIVPGEWWKVVEDDTIIAYGWMDIVWGDGEILLAVADEAQGEGVGTFILDHLEKEAHERGLNRIYNVVRPTHPDREGVTRWLRGRGFTQSHDDERLQRQVKG